MRVTDFDYDLPEQLIAQTPLDERSSSRLLVLDKKTGEIEHKHFYDIVDYLDNNDVLVLMIQKYYHQEYMEKNRYQCLY